MAAAIVLLPTLTLTGVQIATPDSPTSASGWRMAEREQGLGLSSRSASSSCATLDACQQLAARRLRLASWFEQKRNDWRATAKKLRAAAENGRHNPGTAGATSLAVPHLSAWLCIHSHEGAWTDSGDPYWGGLQMDRAFMSAYATRRLLARGWANVWSPREQMWVAERAWRVRGFSPWPTTAAMCGLL